MKWFKEHKLITGIIALLLILAIIFVVSVMGYHQDNGVSDVTGIINQGMSYISGPLSSVTDGIRSTVGGLFAYKQLQEKVETLTAENEALELALAEAALTKGELEELRELSELLNYDYTETSFDIVTADITSMDGSNWTNIFTIDRGVEAGIEVGCVVISGAGLVGKVSQVGEGWAQVVSIIDDGNSVSFMVARSQKLLGIVSGNELGEITGYMIKGSATVTEGDVIITSGIGTYPAGLEIGTITSVTYNSDTLLKEITVEPSVDFRSLKKVSVIL